MASARTVTDKATIALFTIARRKAALLKTAW